MMEPLVFALNAVLPLVLLTALGYFLRRTGVMGEQIASGLNKLCFQVFLPVLLFVNVYDSQGLESINWGVSVFALTGMLASFFLGLILALAFVPDARQKGVVIQCVFRSNFSILGLPLAISLFGAGGAREAAVLSLFAIPLNNILAVVALRMFSKDKNGKKNSVWSMLRDMVTNRLIIGVALGLAALCVREIFERVGITFRLRDIKFLYSALSSVGSVTTPLALISLGALFKFSASRGMLRQISIASLMRVLIVPAVALGAAYTFFPSFYGAPFAALIALFASPVAVSSAVMASEMGGDGELAGQLVVWTTLLSAITIFAFVSVFRALGALS